SNLIAIHANYLGKGDVALLAARKVSVAHCPRSHVYFDHEAFQLRKLLKAGVNVCLGTDSLASVYKRPRESAQLDMFAEMRSLAEAHQWLSPGRILEMATINGARALGARGRLGELKERAWADMIAVPFRGKLAQIHDAVLHH